jgi:hypothetical protein
LISFQFGGIMKISSKHIALIPGLIQKKPADHRYGWWLRISAVVTGLLSLVWFFVRVIPKPSRAAYPCQRAALPLGMGFVIWLLGAIGSAVMVRKVRYYSRSFQYVLAGLCVAASITMALVVVGGENKPVSSADNPIPNEPIGVARGIHPGRVVWTHDPDATDWDGPSTGDGHWWENDNTNLTLVDRMMRRAILATAGETSLIAAWDAIFRHFNQNHGKGDVGYSAGEKITIKINLVGTIGVWGGAGVDPSTYDLVRDKDYMNTSPHMMIALLRQLVEEVGVKQTDIAIGDTLCYFPNQYYDMCRKEFPNISYLDYEGQFGRTAVHPSTIPIYWSHHPSGKKQDVVPVSYAEASYLINLANFKSHTSAGVTLGAKNHYGSLIRWPGQSGYYNLHNDLPVNRSGMGRYRNLVDLMGHAHLGGKTLIYLIDGLYAGLHPTDAEPTRLTIDPFNGDWSSSLFASLDPVAIESVAYDFLYAEEQWENYTHMAGADDYLHEAATADNPVSGTFYDPDHEGNVTRLPSLGVHEHWNGPDEKMYSKNLGSGNGIELFSIRMNSSNCICDMDGDGTVDGEDLAGIVMDDRLADLQDFAADFGVLCPK